MKATVTATKREFALTTAENKRLPKRFPSEVLVKIDGKEQFAPVTNNRAWTGTAADALEYIWVVTTEGVKYITLNYGERAIDLAGSEIVTSAGSGPKPPQRKTATPEAGIREFTRETLFKQTWAAK